MPRYRIFGLLLALLGIPVVVFILVGIGPWDGNFQNSWLDGVSGYLRFRQFIRSPVPDGVYDIHGGCGGTLIDVYAHLTFRFRQQSDIAELTKGMREETRSEFLHKPQCQKCRQFRVQGDSGSLVINEEERTAEFRKNGC